jgi:hypothetical protein
MTDPSTAPDAEPGAPADEAETAEPTEEFTNRAARRSRGKGGAQQPPHGKGVQSSGRGPVQGPRQWGNRRSGG